MSTLPNTNHFQINPSCSENRNKAKQGTKPVMGKMLKWSGKLEQQESIKNFAFI